MDFKVGDTVRILKHANGRASRHIGELAVIKSFNESFTLANVEVESNKDIILAYTGDERESVEIELVKKSNKKEKPDDMVRYIVYGTGCNNKGRIVRTEKELKEELNKHVKDNSWTGKIIGYKLVPLYEAELTTKFKFFKKTTLKKNFK